MLTLCVDTSYKYLCVCLIRDDEVVCSKEYECFKHQSEDLFVVMDELSKDHPEIRAIDSVCFTIGPGSYTGLRIAMTLAKVIASIRNLAVYSVSTLRLYADDQKNTMVLMNARGNRAYIGIYDQDTILLNDCVKELKDIDPSGYNVVGDGSLLGLEDKMPSIAEAFLHTKNYWKREEDVDHLVPMYMKESENYLS